MKKLLSTLLIFLFFPALTSAQSPFARNDNLSTTFTAPNNYGSKAAVTNKGELFITSAGTTSIPTTGPKSSIGTFTAKSVTSSSTSLVAALSTTKGITLLNPQGNTSSIYVAYGFTATASNYSVELVPGAYIEIPLNFINLAINAISPSGTQTLNMTIGT